ncbi:MAG TPA: diacylglycerol kinase family protein [Solirubrobacterales bacterium]|nr:diacylglycerol kinase family protein [Solirubrobacterales bacterium]
MSAEPRNALIVNPSSGAGRGRHLLPDAEEAMNAHGLAHRTIVTRSYEHGVEEARAAAEAGETPVVMSGDGLIGAVGGALANTGTAMGILPGGRGNDFARVLGIPGEVTEAVAVLASGTVREVDVGEVNGKRFLCIASLGFDSDANRIANETKWIRGNLVYAYAALRALAAWKPATFSLSLDGRHREVRGYAVAVANSKAYGGGMFVAPDAVLDDGLFDVVCTAGVSKLRFLTGLPKVFKGTHVEKDEVSVERAAEVRVEADRPFAVYADGEHISDLPATMRVLPRALRVIAPAAGS